MQVGISIQTLYEKLFKIGGKNSRGFGFFNFHSVAGFEDFLIFTVSRVWRIF